LFWLFWRWGFMNYLPWLASNHNPPDLSFLSRITRVNQWHPASLKSLSEKWAWLAQSLWNLEQARRMENFCPTLHPLSLFKPQTHSIGTALHIGGELWQLLWDWPHPYLLLTFWVCSWDPSSYLSTGWPLAFVSLVWQQLGCCLWWWMLGPLFLLSSWWLWGHSFSLHPTAQPDWAGPSEACGTEPGGWRLLAIQKWWVWSITPSSVLGVLSPLLAYKGNVRKRIFVFTWVGAGDIKRLPWSW
jgi:hypothetical protein